MVTDLGGSSDCQMKHLKTVMEEGCISTVFENALIGPKSIASAVTSSLRTRRKGSRLILLHAEGMMW